MVVVGEQVTALENEHRALFRGWQGGAGAGKQKKHPRKRSDVLVFEEGGVMVLEKGQRARNHLNVGGFGLCVNAHHLL